MATDILIVKPDATFAQPEITLGIIPGAGGTQRLTHLVGKARAMDLVLTGRKITGVEAGEWGLASRVTKEGENVVEEAVKVAEKIASFGAVAVQAGKEGVNGGELSIYRPVTLREKTDSSPRAAPRTGPSPRAPPLPAALRYQGPERGSVRLRGAMDRS